MRLPIPLELDVELTGTGKSTFTAENILERLRVLEQGEIELPAEEREREIAFLRELWERRQ